VPAFAVGSPPPATLQLPVLIYAPAQRVAFLARTATGVAMRYYGDLLVASAAGLAAATLVWAFQPRRTPVAVAAGSALSLVALDVAFYLSRLLLGV